MSAPEHSTHIERRAYRRFEVRAAFGASLAAIDREVRAGRIRKKKVGGAVYLHAKDVDAVFGFGSDETTFSAAARDELAELLE